MQISQSDAALRPLGVGETLDRAVTVCVKLFLPLVLIYAAYGVPLALVGGSLAARFLGPLLAAVRVSPGTGPPKIGELVQNLPSEAFPAIGLFAIVALLAYPLPTAALIEATSASYLGRAVTFKEAYAVAFARYSNMLVLTLLYIVAGVAAYIALVALTVVGIFIVIALGAAAKILGIVLGIVLGLAFVFALFAFIVIVIFTVQVGYFTCVVERASAVTSFKRGFARTCARVGLRRSILLGMVYVAIIIGVTIVSLVGQATLGSLLHFAPVAAASTVFVFDVVLRIVMAIFLTAFITVFYFDLRVREEGFDLALAADRALRTASPELAP